MLVLLLTCLGLCQFNFQIQPGALEEAQKIFSSPKLVIKYQTVQS